MRLSWNDSAAAVPLTGVAGKPRAVRARVELLESIPRRSVTVPPPRTDGLETPGSGSRDFLAVQTPERLALEANEVLFAVYNLAQQIESNPGAAKKGPLAHQLGEIGQRLQLERERVDCLVSHADPLVRAKAEEVGLQVDLAFSDLSYLYELKDGNDPSRIRRRHQLMQQRTRIAAQFKENIKAYRPYDSAYLRQVAARNEPLYREYLNVQWELARLEGAPSMSALVMKDWDLGTGRWFHRGVKAARKTFQKIRKILSPAAWQLDRLLLTEKQRIHRRARNFTLEEEPALHAGLSARFPVPTAEQLKPFCNLRQAQANTLDMVGKMFGLTFERMPRAASFDGTNHVYRVTDGQKVIGELTLDLQDRPGKIQRARTMMVSGTPRRVVIQCALPDLGAGCTSPSEFRDFLHELGHGMRALLTENPDEERNGWMLAEEPSMFLDLWASQPEVLRQIFRSGNGTPMPDALVKTVLAERRRSTASRYHDATTSSLLALEAQSRDPRQVDLKKMVRELSQPPHGTRPWRQDDADAFWLNEDLVSNENAYVYTGVRHIVYQMLERFQREGLTAPNTARTSHRVGRAMRTHLLEPTTVGRENVERFLKGRISADAIARAGGDGRIVCLSHDLAPTTPQASAGDQRLR